MHYIIIFVNKQTNKLKKSINLIKEQMRPKFTIVAYYLTLSGFLLDEARMKILVMTRYLLHYIKVLTFE